jgi:hypothetical protein
MNKTGIKPLRIMRHLLTWAALAASIIIYIYTAKTPVRNARECLNNLQQIDSAKEANNLQMTCHMEIKHIPTIALLITACGCAAAETESPNLVLDRITCEQWGLVYKGKKDISMGATINGFTVTKFTPKSVDRTLPNGKTVKMDISELTLKRWNKTIILVKGRNARYNEYTVHLINQSTKSTSALKIGDKIEIGARSLRLLKINAKEHNCTLEDINSGKLFIIKQAKQKNIQ